MSASEQKVHLERVLDAPVEEVFTAWTDPAVMARWWTPTGSAEVDADVRPGGRLRVVMIGEGMRIEHTGEYREVSPPTLLSFTWVSPYTGDVPSLVTIRLTAETPVTTRLVLVHEQLPAEAVESHGGGWSGILDNLAGVLGGAS